MEILSSLRALTTRTEDHSADRPLGLELRRSSNSLENPSTPLSAMFGWLESGNETASGEVINEAIALQISDVFSCIRVLCESAALPCIVYEKTKAGNVEAENHPLHYLLGVEPNIEMSAVTFWEAIIAANCLTGNAYVHIVRNNGGQVAELYPLHPLQTEPFRMPDGTLAFRTRRPNGVDWLLFDQRDILHFRLFSLDGIRGLSPVHQMRQALGLSRACEKYAAKWFGNGALPGGILTGPAQLTPDQRSQAKESWEAAHGGSNQGRTAVLPGEWKFEAMSLSPEASQLTPAREYLRAETAAAFRVPPNMIGDLTQLSNSNHEQQSLSFVTDTLRPILSRIESECNRKLFSQLGAKAGKFFSKFDLSERLRGDSATMLKNVALNIQWGMLSRNEGRIAQGMNPVDDPAMDVRIVAVNMANDKQLLAEANEVNTMEQAPIKPEPGQNDTQPTPKDPA